jgi:peptide-methionine (S)-S-oxide reductase
MPIHPPSCPVNPVLVSWRDAGKVFLGWLLALVLVLGWPGGQDPVAAAAPEPEQQAVLAGGCFWCLEHDLETLPGVLDVQSGYSGGRTAHPTYQQVSAGGTGHQESVRVRFDPAQLSVADLLRTYWRQIDPLDGGGQFCDRGDSYRPVIFVADGTQRRQAEASRAAAALELGRAETDLRVTIQPFDRFWPAEDYHQNYARLQPLKYGYYRWACGRDRRLDAVWGLKARTGEPWGVRVVP